MFIKNLKSFFLWRRSRQNAEQTSVLFANVTDLDNIHDKKVTESNHDVNMNIFVKHTVWKWIFHLHTLSHTHTHLSLSYIQFSHDEIGKIFSMRRVECYIQFLTIKFCYNINGIDKNELKFYKN